MPGIVNLPSARVTAAYAVPDGPCTATTRAASSGAPEESVTTPAIAAVVTPWAPRAVGPANAAAERSREILQGGLMLIPQNRFIGWISRDAERIVRAGSNMLCARHTRQSAPPAPPRSRIGHKRGERALRSGGVRDGKA